MTTINLGDKVKDVVTGFTGIAIGKTQWLYGCARVTVQPEVKKDGGLAETASFDEPSLVVVKAAQVKVGETTARKTGGFDIKISQKDAQGR